MDDEKKSQLDEIFEGNKILETICKKIRKEEGWEKEGGIDYDGLDFSTKDIDERKNVRRKNFKLLKDNFPDYFINLEFDNFKLNSWKGSMWWGEEEEYNYPLINFTGWETETIIEWLINNKPWVNEDELWINEDEIFRLITAKKRYDVCKRQKWRCNTCNERLKYNKNSGWEGEVANIDHIFPFSKRKHYFYGIKNINESNNLQALCPNCNKKKGDKNVA